MARAERLLETAAATLLKTVEEPPAGAVLVLCVEAVELLPATLRSRCQEVEFQRVPDSEILAYADSADKNHDGISGRPNRFTDGRLGRFARSTAAALRRLDVDVAGQCR